MRVTGTKSRKRNNCEPQARKRSKFAGKIVFEYVPNELFMTNFEGGSGIRLTVWFRESCPVPTSPGELCNDDCESSLRVFKLKKRYRFKRRLEREIMYYGPCKEGVCINFIEVRISQPEEVGEWGMDVLFPTTSYTAS